MCSNSTASLGVPRLPANPFVSPRAALTPALIRAQSAIFWHGRVTTTGTESQPNVSGAPPRGFVRTTSQLSRSSLNHDELSDAESSDDEDDSDAESMTSDASGVFRLDQQELQVSPPHARAAVAT